MIKILVILYGLDIKDYYRLFLFKLYFQAKATMSREVPGDILTSAESGKRLVDNWGIKGSELNAGQQEIVKQMIREFVFNLSYEKAINEYEKIAKAGVGNVYFGWIGAYKEKEAHYYNLNGPTFLIEFDNNGGPRRVQPHTCYLAGEG